jgi:hypothetical protein
MPGKRYLLDTNAVIRLLKGDPRLLDLAAGAEWIGISVITRLEFLSYLHLTDREKADFNDFLSRVETIWLDRESEKWTQLIVNFRTDLKLKLPDAIIVATSVHIGAALVTGDQQLTDIQGLELISIK